MAYNTKNIKRDAQGVPIPQYFNSTADDYEAAQGADGAPKVSLSGRKASVASGSYDTVLNVGAGGSTTITITPPTGELWRVLGLYISVPAITGATGTHNVKLYQDTDRMMLLGVEGNANGVLTVYNNLVTQGTGSPGTADLQQRAILALRASNGMPLNLRYINNGNLTQSGTLLITVLREVESVV